MKKVAVVFWSGTGNTEAMAQAVGEGVKQGGAEAAVMSVDQAAYVCTQAGAWVDPS